MTKSSTLIAVLEKKYRRSRILNIVLLALSAFLLIVTVAQFSSSNGGSPAVTSPSTSPSASADSDAESLGLEHRDPDDPAAIGDVDAPVVMVEWVDMRCPFCALYDRDTLPTIISEYVDTGKVRIEVRDVAFFEEQSERASVAVRAAGNQGMYVEYLNAVYAVAPESGHPELPREQLIDFAEQIGIPDIEKFTADLDDPEATAQVQQDTSEAKQIGVNSVPFFVVGTTAMAGAQPIENFRSFLDSALAESD